MISAALNGELNEVETIEDPVFGLHIPAAVEGIPSDTLFPASTWADRAAYDAQARKLATMFKANFEQFEAGVSDEVKAAGPR
jgi:phosphoenolpyruvate carboxykinase (ATP)